MEIEERTLAEAMNTGIGAAYGTSKSGIGIAGVGTFRGDLIMKVRFYICPDGAMTDLTFDDNSPSFLW